MSDALAELRAMSPKARRAILRALAPSEREAVIGLLDTSDRRPVVSRAAATLGLSTWLAELVDAAQNGPRGWDSDVTDTVRSHLARHAQAQATPARAPGRSLLEAVGGLGMTRRRTP